MVSIQDFQSSSFDRKCNFIMLHSDYITMRELDDCKIYLYHSGDFFIEVCYSSPKQRVLIINTFNDQAKLMSYAENVSLDDLRLGSKI